MRALVVVTLAAVSTTAHAEPPSLTPLVEPAQPEASVEEIAPSYRLQTTLADVATLGLGITATKSTAGAGLALGSYLLAAPIVHLAHHNSERAAASFGLRVVMPLLGVAVGAAVGKTQCDQYCDNDADIAIAVLGLFVGAAAASAIDIGYLSRAETVTHVPARTIAPTITTGPNNAVKFGLGGTF